MLRRCDLAALASVLSACTPPAPPSPPSSPTPPPPVAAEIAKAAKAPSPPAAPKDTKPERPKAPPIPLPPPITEALPKLTRPFSLVTLKGVDAQLVSVSGRSERDVWFLSDEEHQMGYQKRDPLGAGQKGVLVHFDGKRVDKQIKHDCWRAQFSHVLVSGDGVILEGNNPFVRLVPMQETALYTGKGKKTFECWNASSEVRAGPSRSAWALQWLGPTLQGVSLGVAGGPKVPLPRFHSAAVDSDEGMRAAPAAWRMVGPDDGFMVWLDEDERQRLLRFNGVTWVTKAHLGDLEVTSMWVESDGQVWLTASLDKADDVILRFDGQALHALPVPPAFKATHVVGGAGKELWFYGFADTVYQYDGARLHVGKAPFPVAEAWVAPNGEVWAVSQENERGPKGVVAHVGPRAEAR